MIVRNSVAIFVGIILGCLSGYSVANAGYGAAVVLGFWSILSPLIVYRIADRRAIWVKCGPQYCAGLSSWIVGTAKISL